MRVINEKDRIGLASNEAADMLSKLDKLRYTNIAFRALQNEERRKSIRSLLKLPEYVNFLFSFSNTNLIFFRKSRIKQFQNQKILLEFSEMELCMLRLIHVTLPYGRMFKL